MAVVHDNTTTGIGSYVTELIFAHTTSGADRLLLVAVVTSALTTSIDTIRFNGADLSPISQESSASEIIELWGLINPDLSGNIVVSVANSGAFTAIANSYAGVDQSTPYGTVVADIDPGAGSATSITLASETGGMCVDVSGNRGNKIQTITGGQTARGQDSSLSSVDIACSEKSGAASVTMSWDYVSDWVQRNQIGVPLRPSSVGGAIFEGTMAAAFSVGASASGKIGIGGRVSTSAGSASLSNTGVEGKQGTLESALSEIIQALGGVGGVSGMLSSVAQVGMVVSGANGQQGQVTGRISLSASLFGTFGEAQVIFEGSLSSTLSELESVLTGGAGVGGAISSQIITAAVLTGLLGSSGSYTISLDNLASYLGALTGVSGQVSAIISSGADLAAKIGISGEIATSLDHLSLQLIEIVMSDRIYQIVISTKTGQAVFLAPKFGAATFEKPKFGIAEITTEI